MAQQLVDALLMDFRPIGVPRNGQQTLKQYFMGLKGDDDA
jgi:hypothetical protein